MNSNLIITCPRCHRQYYFQEIFHPKTIFNPVYNIIRDDKGQIDEIIEDKSDLSELYFCDTCEAPIFVKADISFEISIENKFDFTKDTVIIKND